MSVVLDMDEAIRELILKIEREAEGDVAAVTFRQMLVTAANDQGNLVAP